METEEIEALRKWKKTTEDSGDKEAEADKEEMVEDEIETNIAGSADMEMNINRILERIERFTQQVSELLQVGKAMFKELTAEFEERMITEQIEKWQAEIKELRSLDASNEEASNRLQNAQYLLQNVHMAS